MDFSLKEEIIASYTALLCVFLVAKANDKLFITAENDAEDLQRDINI